LNLDLEGIDNLVNDYEQDSKALKDEIFRICWYMRGTPISECFQLSHEDRKIIARIIEKNLEITKESGIAFV
jgi:hypothetical protein